jgi:hypothetical protein
VLRTGARKEPKDAPADDQQQRDDCEFRATNAMLRTITVIPGEDHCDGQAESKQHRGDAGYDDRPFEGVANKLDAMQEAVGERDVGEAPLHHLALSEPMPELDPLP